MLTMWNYGKWSPEAGCHFAQHFLYCAGLLQISPAAALRLQKQNSCRCSIRTALGAKCSFSPCSIK